VTSENFFGWFNGDNSALGQAKLATVTGLEEVDLARRIQHAKSLEIPKKRLVLRFE
jgi:hypothetical protein